MIPVFCMHEMPVLNQDGGRMTRLTTAWWTSDSARFRVFRVFRGPLACLNHEIGTTKKRKTRKETGIGFGRRPVHISPWLKSVFFPASSAKNSTLKFLGSASVPILNTPCCSLFPKFFHSVERLHSFDAVALFNRVQIPRESSTRLNETPLI
jgi:hypothetical protein